MEVEVVGKESEIKFLEVRPNGGTDPIVDLVSEEGLKKRRES
jgi:hypothetical protein